MEETTTPPESIKQISQKLSDSEISNMSAENKAAALNWLEVQSTSTTSLPISFPFHYMTDHTNSLDTFSLFNRLDEEPGPKYSNTSHLKSTDVSPVKLQITEDIFNDEPKPIKGTKGNHKQNHSNTKGRKGSYSTGTISSNEQLFNQVPKRFSQFILDQQNPHMAQRLDNLSVISPSFYSVNNPGRDLSNKGRDSSKYRPRPAKSITSFGQPFTLSRQDSISVESQATIFSTRDESQILLQGPQVPLRPRNRFGFRRTRTRNSKMKVEVYSQTSSSLERSNAIRDSKGSVFYRMKLRLKKLLSKLKFFKFHNFTASSKRTGSIRRRKTKTLRRKFRTDPKNQSVRRAMTQRKLQISAPQSNPDLGRGQAERVHALDDNLKYLAGAPAGNMNFIPPVAPNEGKIGHLEAYIGEQQTEYIKDLYPRAQSIYGTNPIASTSKQYAEPTLPEFRRDEPAEYPISETEESEAPPPPPHLVAKTVPTSKEHEPVLPQHEVIDLWRSYLGQVLAKRIQLRQEIDMFRSFMISREDRKAFDNQEYEELETVAADTMETSSAAPLSSEVASVKVSMSEFTSETLSRRSILSSSIMQSRTSHENDDIEDDLTSVATSQIRDSESDEFVDEDAEEFHKKVLNRRSILGDMLEYDSDGDSVASSSVYSGPSVGASQLSRDLMSKRSSSTYAHSEILSKTYGTISRRNTVKFERRLSETSTQGTIPRSSGIQHSLHDLSFSEE
ncbi:uncharacterized protein RJT20DRAFT_130582 [Scheffersomyces xylosifermentans]|uniref:uncharacterized protein n=1 Tax=Scheffersomyces xylosifermentans TaxID=1304137 RepID=UPI00315CBC43